MTGFDLGDATSAPNKLEGLRITVFRAIFFCLGLSALSLNLEADLNAISIFFAGSVGAVVGLRCANSKLSGRGFSSLLLSAVIFWFGLRYLVDQINPGSGAFGWFVVSRSFELYLAVAALLAVFEWLYRRTASWLTVEAALIAGLAVYALAPHRRFRLDSPHTIAELAWNWNSNPIAVFIGVGSALVGILILFVAVCAKPRGRALEPVRRKAALGVGLAVAGLILAVSLAAFRLTSVAAGSRLMNGVGQDNSEGVSPLSFQSALGATNQPSAVVRLEGDYKDNPTTPMLYIREDALSEFNGTEMVHSGGAYDRDVIRTPPDQVFKANEYATLAERVPLPHSVYLLAEHKIPFAVDFPISLTPLRNPNPGKFKGGAYRVYSQAPVYKVQDLTTEQLGNPAWDEVERQHYLKRNPDPRYAELAIKITGGVTNGVERAFEIAKYLSAKSIYTLAPNHEVKDGDQTAPYIFGDMRGYCVHFAHAMVYLFRSIGIPSRIGTGYLTDLSQAKDGHILLRMSDRHAWAEIYVTNKGWVTVDVQPEQVESHGESEVDQKLLEDLMSQLDPGEEILPKEPAKPEPGLEKDKSVPWSSYLPNRIQLIFALLSSLATMIAIKVFLKRILWRLPLTPALRLKLAYRAQALNAAELGLARSRGETRLEFKRRATATLGGVDPLSLTSDLNKVRYDITANGSLSFDAPRFIAPKTFFSRLVQILSPASIGRFFAP